MDAARSTIRGTAIIEEGGVRVGVIGLITEDTPYATMAQYVARLEFAEGGQTMDRLIPMLRGAGVDFVIVVAHAGTHCETPTHDCAGEMVDWLSRTSAKPDVVAAGHTHASVRTRVSGVVMVELGTMRLATGEPIRDDEVYSVMVSDFLATGMGDGFAPLTDALERTATRILDLDALIDYLQSLPQPVRAHTDTRIHVINDAAVRRP